MIQLVTVVGFALTKSRSIINPVVDFVFSLPGDLFFVPDNITRHGNPEECGSLLPCQAVGIGAPETIIRRSFPSPPLT